MADDTIRAGENGEAELQAAVDAARGSIGQFVEAFTDQKPGQDSFLVSVAFIEGTRFERIWISGLDVSGETLRGVVASEPALPGFSFGQPVEFTYPQITDWMYVEDGHLVGGYTMRVIRRRLSAGKRAQFDAEVPFTF
jgi:uncharacterized protein YegJ (DUF2314 family)